MCVHAFLVQSVCVFVCSYMSVLNACQGIYLVSAFRHVCLFSFSHVCLYVFPNFLEWQIFPYSSVGGKKEKHIPIPIG